MLYQFAIVNPHCGADTPKALTARSDGTVVIEGPQGGNWSPAQKWTVWFDGVPGLLRLRNVGTGLMLDCAGRNQQLTVTAQGADWTVGEVSSGVYGLSTMTSGGVAMVDLRNRNCSAGTMVWGYAPNGTVAQQWTLAPVAPETHTVIVSVDANGAFTYSVDGGGFAADPELDVGGPAVITFSRNQGETWAFVSIGVRGSTGADEVGLGDFSSLVHATQMSLTDHDRHPGSYEYSVTVKDADGDYHTGDPKIVNKEPLGVT